MKSSLHRAGGLLLVLTTLLPPPSQAQIPPVETPGQTHSQSPSPQAPPPDPEQAITALSGVASIEELDENEYERLEALHASPVPINVASPSRLLSCGLLSRFQVLSLVDYRTSNGAIRSLSELAMVDGFSREEVERLAPFISLYARSPIGAKAPQGLRTSLTGRLDAREQGWGYAAKAQVSREDRFTLSGTARARVQERPGAPDTWSLHAMLPFRTRTGKLLIGDYNARFGQGLTLWNGFSMSGFSTAGSFARHPTGLSPAWSLSPDGPLRGIGADLSLGRVTVSAASAFPGLRERMDGDPRSGISAFGVLNTAWTSRRAEASLTALWAPGKVLGADSDRKAPAMPSSKLSADCRWTPGRLSFFAEAALDLHHRSLGAVGGLIWSPAYQKKAALLLRGYPAGFDGTLAGGARTGTRCSGESGIAAALTLPYLSLSADYARFSAKQEAQTRLLGIVTLHLGPHLTVKPRGVLRARNGTLREEARLESSWEAGGWLLRARGDWVHQKASAYLTYAEAGCKREHFQLYARGGLFAVDNWDDRIYVYERDAPGCFNVPAYYGRGCNVSLVAACKWPSHRLDLRLGAVRYFTDKPSRLECRLQYTWKHP